MYKLRFMRILVIHNFYQHAGGEDVVFRQEVEELAKRHDVQTLTFQNKKGFRGVIQFLLYPWNILARWQVKKAIRAFKPDIIHLHNLHYASGPAIIRLIHDQGIPLVMTLHNYRLLCPSASLFTRGQIFTESITQQFPWTAIKLRVLDHSLLKTWLTAGTYWLHRKLGTWDMVHTYLVLSSFAKRIFAESTFPVANEKFLVRPNSIAQHSVKVEKEQRLVYIGRFSTEKGIIPLLEAIAGSAVSLDLYGTGPQLDLVKQYVDANAGIRYMGYQPPEVLTSAIAQADALIVPSVCYEGMPMTIIEAFAQGTPVLASAIGILQEMVVPLYTGMLFDPFDKSSVQDCIARWVNLDRTKKMEIAINCQQEYEKQYTLTKNMERLTAIYQEAAHTIKK